MLKEKDNYAEAMQCELDDAKLKAFEAESVVGRIVDLIKELVISTKEENFKFPMQFMEKPVEDFKWRKKQLEDELELTKENLKEKEMELLAAQRQIAIKEEELEIVNKRLEERERELKALKEERVRDVDDMKKLSISGQESVGEKGLEDVTIEKLQLEAAQLEVEAATNALHKLAEMSRELLNKASLSIDYDLDVNVIKQDGVRPNLSKVKEDVAIRNGFDQDLNGLENEECLMEIKSEVARLSALTEMLVQEASSYGLTQTH